MSVNEVHPARILLARACSERWLARQEKNTCSIEAGKSCDCQGPIQILENSHLLCGPLFSAPGYCSLRQFRSHHVDRRSITILRKIEKLEALENDGKACGKDP